MKWLPKIGQGIRIAQMAAPFCNEHAQKFLQIPKFVAKEKKGRFILNEEYYNHKG